MSGTFADWVGRSETTTDTLEPARTNALNIALGNLSTLDNGSPLPNLFHWLYFWDVRLPSALGSDGHPAKGGFLPPVPLPRRMWAGGRVEFLAPLHLGEKVTRTSTILNVKEKSGRSGQLVFVTVKHELSGPDGAAISEEQDIVYRGAAAAGSIAGPSAQTEAPAAAWCEEVTPDQVLLFRYSALTLNGHRIHYDRPYAMNEEAYPGLVVHGPLQATLLASLAARKLRAPLEQFEFRGQSPAFDGHSLFVCGEKSEEGASLWTEQGGMKSMVATARAGSVS